VAAVTTERMAVETYAEKCCFLQKLPHFKKVQLYSFPVEPLLIRACWCPQQCFSIFEYFAIYFNNSSTWKKRATPFCKMQFTAQQNAARQKCNTI